MSSLAQWIIAIVAMLLIAGVAVMVEAKLSRSKRVIITHIEWSI